MNITLDSDFLGFLLEKVKSSYCTGICKDCPMHKTNHNFDAEKCSELTYEQMIVIFRNRYNKARKAAQEEVYES